MIVRADGTTHINLADPPPVYIETIVLKLEVVEDADGSLILRGIGRGKLAIEPLAANAIRLRRRG